MNSFSHHFLRTAKLLLDMFCLVSSVRTSGSSPRRHRSCCFFFLSAPYVHARVMLSCFVFLPCLGSEEFHLLNAEFHIGEQN